MTLSGLHPRKAVHDVITAFSQVVGDFPHWHLNIVGDGPDRERLITLVADLDLEKSIHFLGSTLTPARCSTRPTSSPPPPSPTRAP